MDAKPVEVIAARNNACPLIITCEHASSDIPSEYNNLGLSPDLLDTHIARDKGAREVTYALSAKLGCRAVLGGYSRLLIDLNRRENEDELLVEKSDGILINGNQNLSSAERSRRIDKYYRPYYSALEEQIALVQNQALSPLLFSVHSFTPQLRGGEPRLWQAGILWHKPARLAQFTADRLRARGDKIIGTNVPYDLRLYNTGAVVVCGEEKGLDYGLIEIRDDEFTSMERGVRFWSDALADILQCYIHQGR
ncbi:MAG: N-formylglutamate amidohydrolase [Alphaproteobacteria bacterium]|nr:N-formylglutamate amidohydrolase [Alphaproteobacteria bacterium]